MKRMSLWLVLLMLLSVIPVHAENADISLTVNEIEMSFAEQEKPFMEGNSVMVPLEMLVEEFCGSFVSVENNGTTVYVATVEAVYQEQQVVGKAVRFTAESKEADYTNILITENGYTYGEIQNKPLSAAVREKDGIIFFPLKEFCECTGAVLQESGGAYTVMLDNAARALTVLKKHYDDKEYEAGLVLADKLIKRDLIEAYNNKAYILFAQNDYERAKDTLEALLVKNPNNERALYNLACACAQIGQVDKSIASIKKLLSMHIEKKADLRADADLTSLRDNAVFQNLMGISVRVGGKLLEFDVPPQIVNDRTLVPMRAIFDELGAAVEWDAGTRTVTAVKNGKTVSLTLDETTAQIDSEPYTLEAAPVIYKDRTLVPCRFVADVFGAAVDWLAENQLVEITFPAPDGSAGQADETIKKLNEQVVVSVVDGGFAEPYSMDVTEGRTMIIAKDEQALELIDSLDEASRIKWMAGVTYENYAAVLGCDPVYVTFVVNGKIYYEGVFSYENEETLQNFKYYQNGLPANVVKQYRSKGDYKDFYLLPESERTTTDYRD